MAGKKRRGGGAAAAAGGRWGETEAVAEEGNNELSYEAERNAMLVENQKRMKELGLLEPNLFPSTPSPRAARLAKQKLSTPSPISAGPARRSSRLQGASPVSYKDQLDNTVEDARSRRRADAWGEGSKAEIYTEEDEKKLGSYETEWELFKDGCGPNGRIYDPTNGKTCHQCRQKTLGHRTSCSQCKALQGQFCGDCIFMRYGENVLETMKKKNWVCPICRGICNCSLCRPKRGWLPTGSLYRRAIAEGYKSVAHYLILTRRGESTPLA